MTRILIIKTEALGDVLRTTCILSGLSKKYSNAQIDWITAPASKTLLVGNPLVSQVLNQFDYSDAKSQNLNYDLIINLDDSIWACRFASSFPLDRLSGAYYLNDVRTYTSDCAKWFDMSLISRHGKDVADKLKKENRQTYPDLLFEMLDISPGAPSLAIPDHERSFAHSYASTHFQEELPVIGLNTGAGNRWQFKQLTIPQTTSLIDLLSTSIRTNLVLFGGPNESERNRTLELNSNFPVVNPDTSNNLLKFSALIERCNLLVTSDSLAFHIASCLKIPTIVFFGPTSAHEIKLFGPGKKIVPNMSCICCYLQQCSLNNTCMDNISIHEILDTIKTLISTTPKE